MASVKPQVEVCLEGGYQEERVIEEGGKEEEEEEVTKVRGGGGSWGPFWAIIRTWILL